MNGYKFLSSIGEKTKSVLSKGLKIALYGFLIFMSIVILKGMLKKDEMVIQPISTPKLFKESGFEGAIVAEKLEENIARIYGLATTVREDSMQINVDQSKDINMNVMGLGVSASNIVYHLRDLLGIQTNYITGHITDMDHTLSLKLNISHPRTSKEVHISYNEEEKLEVFDSLIYLGAQFITEINDPYRMAVYFHQNSDDENALRIVRKLAKSKTEKKWAYNLWANIVKKDKGTDAAIEFYKYALKDDPDFVLAHRNLGFTYFSIDSFELAIKHFEASANLDTDNVFNANNVLAICYKKLGDSKTAETYYKKNISQFPSSVWGYRNYSEFLLERGDTSAVMDLFKKAQTMSLEGADYFMMMGGYYYYSNEIDSALYYFDKVSMFDPENMDALMAGAEISFENKRYDKAVPYYKEALIRLKSGFNNSDNIIGMLNRLALCENSSGQPDSAIVHINQAISMAPQYGILHSTLAEAYAVKGQEEKFFQILQIAFEKGFTFNEEYWEDVPYSDYKNSARLLKLIAKYAPKEEEEKSPG